MEVVYYFSGSGGVRIPLYGYDRDLYNLLLRRGGYWDRTNREFIFRNKRDPVFFQQVFKLYPSVWVDENDLPTVKHFIYRNIPAGYNLPIESQHKTPASNRNQSERHSKFEFIAPVIQPERFSADWQKKLEAELHSRKYSAKTIKAYVYYNALLCRNLQKIPEEINSDDITEFLAAKETENDYSASALNFAISAFKFFYRNVLQKENVTERHRPRRDEKLPQVLSKEEITKILGMENNPKHKLLLMLAYSSGLRVSEVVVLKKEHIDYDRKVIYVRQGKGRKDRNTVLSEKAASFLKEYCEFYNIKTWIFPGQPSASHLTIRSAQNIFDKAIRKAQIPKHISIHSLRHTFATHLLENGTDIRYIQNLLGHTALRTTERYTHVARRSLQNIKSPLDTIP